MAITRPLVKGDKETLDFVVTNPNNTARNITTDALTFTVKTKHTDTAALLAKTSADGGVQKTDAAQGKASVPILPAD
ncbi:MAG: hypothetical protein ACRC0L_06060, partial [Angustibacter sp.]